MRRAISTGKMVVILTIFTVILLAAVLIMPPQTQARERVFYIVAYHWGFALYDENFNEIPRIEVEKGDKVTLHLIPASALGHEAHEEFEERVINNGIGNLAPNDPRIHEELEKAREEGLLDHGISIPELGINIITDVSKVGEEAHSLREVMEMGNPGGAKATFIANKPGTYNIFCNTYCGFGHGWMTLEGAIVVSG